MKDKKDYYREYHKKTYKAKANACDVCGKDLTGSRKKRCNDCKVKSVCELCGKDFFYRLKYKKCPKCLYHWTKKNRPEEFAEVAKKRNAKNNATLRSLKGLPIDHVFPKGPRGLGYLNKKGYLLVCYKDHATGNEVVGGR